MSIASIIPNWISKYSIRSIINAPCAGKDCTALHGLGAERILGIDRTVSSEDNHIVADLRTWKPSEPWDAVYVNCIFCHNLYGSDNQPCPMGDYQTLARNYASWPVKYIMLYDTIAGFDWSETFKESGWRILETSDDCERGNANVRVQLWGR